MSEKIFQLIVWPLFVLIATTYAQAPAQSASSPQDIPSGRGSGARGGAGTQSHQGGLAPSSQASFPSSGQGSFGVPALGSVGFWPQDCVDKHPKCAYWAERGECDINPGYMRTYCIAACTPCSPPRVQLTCEDSTRKCVGWKQNNECDRQAPFMLDKCPKTCGFCQFSGDIIYPYEVLRALETPSPIPPPNQGIVNSCVGKPFACRSMPNGPCTDDHPLCPFWASAAQNQCILNPIWMTQSCTVSCNKC